MSLKSILKNNSSIVISYDKARELYYRYLVSDEKIVRKNFKERLGREVELNKPIKYNDKIQWLKLNWYDPLATQCADKYDVRNIVENRIGSEYLNELYAVYETVEEIDIGKLPTSFVLKGTHGSGYNIICKDKYKMNWDLELKKMKRWLNNNYYWAKRESVYKNIKPRIICEKYIKQEGDSELRDYRFFCFNGEPKFISVDFSITDKNRTRRNLYDLNWNLIDAEISYPKELSMIVQKPNKLEEMIELSKQLSSSFPHARVDFYYIGNKIIFGEITFFHQIGMGKITPESFEVAMGNWIDLKNLH